MYTKLSSELKSVSFPYPVSNPEFSRFFRRRISGRSFRVPGLCGRTGAGRERPRTARSPGEKGQSYSQLLLRQVVDLEDDDHFATILVTQQYNESPFLR